VGYDCINVKNKSLRKELIQRLQKLRKIGSKMPPPYPNGWFAVMESRDLSPGQSKSVHCLGETFAVFRTEEGKAYVLDAYCPHLGANIGTGGVVRGDCIECPFHQWMFSGEDGECKNIPYSSSPIPKQARLKKWMSQETNGSIFVWYHAENDEPWTLPSIKEIDDGDWVYHGRNSFEINCHIQEIPENGADVAHLAAVHGPNMFAGSDLRFTRSFLDCIAMHTWDAK
jgi:cholesterol 7-desaturase